MALIAADGQPGVTHFPLRLPVCGKHSVFTPQLDANVIYPRWIILNAVRDAGCRD
ncbi:hypothetical protein KCP78_24455 [Salmonella enterica subsp. enterica]|nr:hypothetical protein KCP78_24455 [Salmonella enterica subsp. enterica]